MRRLTGHALLRRAAYMGIGIIGGLVTAGTGLAQSDSEEALEALRACAEIESDSARLACVDEVLAAEADSSEQPTVATPPPPAPVATPAPAAPAAPAATADERPAPAAPAASRTPAAAAEPPAPAAPAPTPAPATVSASNRSAAPQREEAETDDDMTLVIVEVNRTALGNWWFVTGDGRVWDQTSSRAGRFPATPFEAVFSKALVKSYFITSPLGGLRVRVSERD